MLTAEILAEIQLGMYRIDEKTLENINLTRVFRQLNSDVSFYYVVATKSCIDDGNLVFQLRSELLEADDMWSEKEFEQLETIRRILRNY